MPFKKALITNDRSTLPVHITRITLLSGVYCSLDTPAKSAAPYAHDWQTNPNILGVNLRPVLIRFSPPYLLIPSLRISDFLQACRCINLAQHLFIGKVFQLNSPCRTHGVTKTISLTESRINRGLSALWCHNKLDGTIG